MPRVKGGIVTRKRRKKVMKLAKGYRGAKHMQFKAASTQLFVSYKYALLVSTQLQDKTTSHILS